MGNFSKYIRKADSEFFSTIHRARVQDVNLVDGTVRVIIEGTGQPRKALMPFLGLSLPPGDDTGVRASWGRYIPQEGDMILVGFDSNGEIYSLGYHAVYYKAFGILDDAREAKGGIGWGDPAGMLMKPGDWHFKSGRNCVLYLGTDVRLSAGPHSLHLRKSQGDATLTSGLNITKSGEASELRSGNVRRFLLPTDSEEAYIPSALNPLQTAQEWTNIVRIGSTLVIGGVEICRTSQGEVIDEVTKLPMIASTAYPNLSEMPATGFVRRLETVTDDVTGAVPLYSKVIDNLGNQGISALTATVFQWFTPLAGWSTTCLSFDVTASDGISFTAGVNVGVTAGAGFDVTSATSTITAADIKLGSSAATSFLIKGTEHISALQTNLPIIAAAFTKLAGDVGLSAIMDPATATALTAAATALGTLTGLLSSHLSVTTKVQ